VEDEEHGDDAEDVALEAELAEGVALMHVVPFRVGLACGGGLETVGGAWGKGGGVFGDDWGVAKVCEVCVSSGDALAYVNIYKPGILRCLEAPPKHGACPFGLSRRCVGGGFIVRRVYIPESALGTASSEDLPRRLSRKLAMVAGVCD
jgi:hypothetical protein